MIFVTRSGVTSNLERSWHGCCRHLTLSCCPIEMRRRCGDEMVGVNVRLVLIFPLTQFLLGRSFDLCPQFFCFLLYSGRNCQALFHADHHPTESVRQLQQSPASAASIVGLFDPPQGPGESQCHSGDGTIQPGRQQQSLGRSSRLGLPRRSFVVKPPPY